MNYISFDMEWNQPYAKEFLKTRNNITLYGEITQIGAIKMDEFFNIIDTFKVTIKPTVYKKMNKRISKLTKITDAAIERYGVSREVALKSFFDWCGKDSVFLTWGNEDFDIMEKNLKFFYNTDDLPIKCYNLQCIYNYDNDCCGRMYSLEHAMESFNIESELDRHDALNDAYFTALVSKHLNIEQGIRNYERICEISTHTSDYLMSLEFDGYKNSIEAMKDKCVIYSACPFCNAKSKLVKKWRQGKLKYVFLNECKHHGYFISRIRVNKNNDKSVVANKELYRYDESNKQYFERKFAEWTVV